MNSRLRPLVIILATGFGAGYSPIIPGTVGTLVGVALSLPLLFVNRLVYAILLVPLTLISFWIADEAQRIFQQKDCRKIVIDEIIGYFITVFLLASPANSLLPDVRARALQGGWQVLSEIGFWQDFLVVSVPAFVFFRLTDIFKPFPARFVDQRLHNGVGVVLDDVFAGIYANLALHALVFYRCIF